MIFGNNVFVHIPKTGGQTIYSLLKLKHLEHNADNLHGSGNPELSHLTALEIKNRISNYDERFSFAFVRNPWDRFISEYLFRNRDVINGSIPSCGLPFYANWGFKEIPSIKELLLQLQEIKPNIRKLCHPTYNHFFDQTDFVQNEDGKVIVNHIGRFENFVEECKILCKIFKVSYNSKFHRNKSKRLHYSAYYDIETKKLIHDLYKKDIEFFGYKFEEKAYIKFL